MSDAATTGPFPPDPAIAARNAQVLELHATTFVAALDDVMAGPQRDGRHAAAAVPAAVVAQLVDAFGLAGPDEAAILAVEPARRLARASVSGYHVGAAALTTEGDLLLGGNVELPGASIWQTVHAEGFVTLLARARSTQIRLLATSQARPCAHCRQVLTEMAGAEGLILVDPPGRRLRLSDIYPWPFAPSDLGTPAASDAPDAFPFLALDDTDLPDRARIALVEAGRRGHAPYSGCPAACVLRLADDTLVAGTVLENVAFNPTIGPVQDALVGVLATGRPCTDIREGWVAVGRQAQVGHEAMARDALAAAAPGAVVNVRYWS